LLFTFSQGAKWDIFGLFVKGTSCEAAVSIVIIAVTDWPLGYINKSDTNNGS